MTTLIKKKMVQRSTPTDDLDNELTELWNDNCKYFKKLVESINMMGKTMENFIRDRNSEEESNGNFRTKKNLK